MKYLPLLFLLTGCSLFNGSEPITVTSTIPVDVYNFAGGNSLELTQSNGIAPMTSMLGTVEGTSFVFSITGCKISYNVQQRDPVNYLHWLSQPLTISYDPNLLNCVNVSSCTVDTLSVSMVGTAATATFTCDPV